MILQLTGTKYMQICEAGWAESNTESTTRLPGRMRRCMDGHLEMNHMSDFKALALWGTTTSTFVWAGLPQGFFHDQTSFPLKCIFTEISLATPNPIFYLFYC